MAQPVLAWLARARSRARQLFRFTPPPRSSAAEEAGLRMAAPDSGPPARRGVLPIGLQTVLLGVVYVIAGKLGLSLAIVHPSASAVWAPSGIALAALIVMGYRVWPGIFLGALIVNVTTAGSIFTSLGIATGNTLEGLIGAYLVNRFANGRDAFERPQDTFRFALLAGMAATAVAATIGVTSLALGGFALWSEFRPVWLTWWLGDMSGALLVTPLILVWLPRRRFEWRVSQAFEGALLLVSLVIVGQLVFGSPLSELSGHPLVFLCMPLLVWAAFRFDSRVASAALVLLSAIAVLGTLSETAPIQRWQLNESLLVLQVFMSVAAVTTLALAAMVAERARVEEAVRAASEELRDALTGLQTFSHSISHDLRSPVGAVLNYSAVLEEDFAGRLDDEVVHMVRRIRASAEAAGGLLDQLVQFGWVERERHEPRPIDMTSLARDVRTELASASEEPGELQVSIGELPPAWGSATLVRCVFRNLMSNAIKYTRGRGHRRVEVRGSAGELENTYYVIDNGMGFDPRLSDEVFLPFRRLGDARNFEGSGLGLAIVARIVRRHRGRVWAESDGSSGARFGFTLPAGRGIR